MILPTVLLTGSVKLLVVENDTDQLKILLLKIDQFII